MKNDLCLPDKSQIANEILAYLAEHPDAEDTLDGIVKWWQLERKIKLSRALLENTLSQLVKKDLLTFVRKDKEIYYRARQKRGKKRRP